MTVYNAVVVPTLVYGCEAWVLKDRDESSEESGRCNQIGLREK